MFVALRDCCSSKAARKSVGFLPKTTSTVTAPAGSWCHSLTWGTVGGFGEPTTALTVHHGYQQFLPGHYTHRFLPLWLCTDRPVTVFLACGGQTLPYVCSLGCPGLLEGGWWQAALTTAQTTALWLCRGVALLFRPVTWDTTEAHSLLTGGHTLRKLAKQKKESITYRPYHWSSYIFMQTVRHSYEVTSSRSQI